MIRSICTGRIALLLAASPLLPSAAAAEAEREEVVAEALFLCDALPPGGRDVNLSLRIEEGEPDAVTGETELVSLPRAQLAMALGRRVGFTADVGVTTARGAALDAPSASLKLLLRAPGAGRTGLAASLDLLGSTHSLAEVETGVGVGAIRPAGPLTLRAALSAATGVSSWSPHLHGGLSAAAALGPRWRALAEITAEISSGAVILAAGPTVKLALGERTAVMAGALFRLGPATATPVLTVQLTQAM